MKFLGGLMLCVPFVLYILVISILSIQLNINCLGHLKRAADANTIKIAKQELEVSVKYLEDKKLTKGYTSVFYNTPDEDIEFWYNNLSSSLEGLKKFPANASQLEESNVLMKLRETLLDNGKNGQSITCPDGLSRYPANILFAIWGTLSGFMFLIGAALIKIFMDEN